MEKVGHPSCPPSNVAKFVDYDPANYAISNVSPTLATNEALVPGCAPHLTQKSIAKYLAPLTRELNEVPARPTINELPDAVIDQMVKRDKAFWVDKPGVNDYVIHDSYHHYGLSTVVVKPVHQDPFPRSYQYDLDCVRYRRTHACDGLKQQPGEKKKRISVHCRDCTDLSKPALTPFQLAWVKDPGQKRWRYYPDLNVTLTREEIRASMDEGDLRIAVVEEWQRLSQDTIDNINLSMSRRVGRPFYNEACNWYYENYPPVKYDCIVRKFSK